MSWHSVIFLMFALLLDSCRVSAPKWVPSMTGMTGNQWKMPSRSCTLISATVRWEHHWSSAWDRVSGSTTIYWMCVCVCALNICVCVASVWNHCKRAPSGECPIRQRYQRQCCPQLQCWTALGIKGTILTHMQTHRITHCTTGHLEKHDF